MKRLMMALVALAACSADARDPEHFDVWPKDAMPHAEVKFERRPFCYVHFPGCRQTDSVMIVAPGGAYDWIAWDYEGFPIRDYLLSRGMTVVLLMYRTPRPQGLPKHQIAWEDIQRTIRVVRSRAADWKIDSEKIGVLGFSAGGHLAMMAATCSQTPAYAPLDAVDKLPCHCNFAVPVYPAYVLADGMDDQGNKLKGNDLTTPFAPEFKFDAKTPPMCFLHGDGDTYSPMGSVRAYHKLRTMGIPAELHVMARRPHGFQLHAQPGTPAFTWMDRIWEWMTQMGFNAPVQKKEAAK